MFLYPEVYIPKSKTLGKYHKITKLLSETHSIYIRHKQWFCVNLNFSFCIYKRNLYVFSLFVVIKWHKTELREKNKSVLRKYLCIFSMIGMKLCNKCIISLFGILIKLKYNILISTINFVISYKMQKIYFCILYCNSLFEQYFALNK